MASTCSYHDRHAKKLQIICYCLVDTPEALFFWSLFWEAMTSLLGLCYAFSPAQIDLVLLHITKPTLHATLLRAQRVQGKPRIYFLLFFFVVLD